MCLDEWGDQGLSLAQGHTADRAGFPGCRKAKVNTAHFFFFLFISGLCGGAGQGSKGS